MLRSALLLGLFPLVTIAAADAEEIAAVLRAMETSGKEFDPGRLHQQGTAGLEAVFDRLMPHSRPLESAAPLPQRLAELAANLGSDDFPARRAAVEQLTALGELARAHVVQASRSEDPEVRLRATEVLDEWKKLPLRRPGDAELKENVRFREAFELCLEQFTDDARLGIVVRRVQAALKVGLLDQETRQGVRLCLRRMAALKQDRWFDELQPLLAHEDEEVPLLLIHSIGAAKQADYFPTLFLAGLESDREAVVEAVLSWSLDCGDQEQRPHLQARLRRLFHADKESLKLRACWPLMRNFGDEKAFDYLVSQAKNEDSGKARIAMGWLADGCNAGEPVTPTLLEALTPQLAASDFFVRRDAAQALAVFQGDEVLRNLLPLLADEKPAIIALVSAEFLRDSNRQLGRTLLKQTIESTDSERLREAACKVLARMEATGK